MHECLTSSVLTEPSLSDAAIYTTSVRHGLNHLANRMMCTVGLQQVMSLTVLTLSGPVSPSSANFNRQLTQCRRYDHGRSRDSYTGRRVSALNSNKAVGDSRLYPAAQLNAIVCDAKAKYCGVPWRIRWKFTQTPRAPYGHL